MTQENKTGVTVIDALFPMDFSGSRRDFLKRSAVLAAMSILGACMPWPEVSPSKDVDAELVNTLRDLLEYKDGMTTREFMGLLDRKTYVDDAGKWATSRYIGQYKNSEGKVFYVATSETGQAVSTKDVKDTPLILFPKPNSMSRAYKDRTIVPITGKKGQVVVVGTWQTTQSIASKENTGTLITFVDQFFGEVTTTRNTIYLNYLPANMQLIDPENSFTGVDPYKYNPPNAYSQVTTDLKNSTAVLNMNILTAYADAYGLPLEEVIYQALGNELGNIWAGQKNGTVGKRANEAPSLLTGILTMKDKPFRTFLLGSAADYTSLISATEARRLKIIGRR